MWRSRRVYGVLNPATGEFIDVSLTERGAKQIATRGGYRHIGYRYNGGYDLVITHVKKGNKWVVMPEDIIHA